MQRNAESFDATRWFMHNTRDDQEWVAQLRSEDPATQRQAFLDLGQYLYRAVFNYLRMRRSSLPRLRDMAPEELEELAGGFAQEALQRIWEKLPSYTGRGKFTAWAATIAVRTAGYELRKPYWQERRLPAAGGHADEDDPLEWQRYWRDVGAISPEQSAQQQEILDLIEAAVREDLSERQRRAFIAQFLEERSSDDIARELGTTRTAVYQLIHEARKKIKRRLLAAGHTPQDILETFTRDETGLKHL